MIFCFPYFKYDISITLWSLIEMKKIMNHDIRDVETFLFAMLVMSVILIITILDILMPGSWLDGSRCNTCRLLLLLLLSSIPSSMTRFRI